MPTKFIQFCAIPRSWSISKTNFDTFLHTSHQNAISPTSLSLHVIIAHSMS